MPVSAAPGLPVHNINTGRDYPTSNDAIRDAATIHGHTIPVDSGLYVEGVGVTESLTTPETVPGSMEWSCNAASWRYTGTPPDTGDVKQGQADGDGRRAYDCGVLRDPGE